jgi:predicted GNAT family N-acyltransferase
MEILDKEIQVVPLSQIHNTSDFDCEDSDINEFLKRDALLYQKIQLAKIYVLIYRENIVGFFSLSTDSIKLKNDEKVSSPKLKTKRLCEFPAVKIGRLGIDKRFKEMGFGKRLLMIAIGLIKQHKIFGCRFITVDSYPKVVNFYSKYGFIKNEHEKYTNKDDYVSMRFDLLNESLSEEELKNIGLKEI